MKHFMMPRNHVLRENHDAAFTTSPNPKSKPHTSPNPSTRKFKSSKENSDPNSVASTSTAGKTKSPLPPRPLLKRKLSVESAASETCAASSLDSGVKVIVRVRPPNNDDQDEKSIVEKHTANSISVSGQSFTFDSVADIQSKQIDIFRLVGEPLVENCLAGFNSSVFAYGQTGSGKTYTIWGGSNTLFEEDHQGLAPRVFSKLFARINEEQVKHADKQLVYLCRCSFLEIYNEQITDLLDPSQKNLQIREDVKAGVYVENLREECVSSMKDVSQLLMKGLSNRRTSATHANAESSRSHSVFTCLVESRSKNVADGLSSLKMSKINFVDLAGSERQKQTGAAGERLKEAVNINRSLSQLGNLINILAEVSQTGKQRHIPYRDSKLTFLLQESLGGNAKLAMICAVSPNQSCKSETLSTLRFAQRAKAIKNKAVVNEEMQDDVNVLRGVIRQLRDELHRMKGNDKQTVQNGVNTTGWSARRSLNLLRFSLSRPMTLPHTEDDSDEEMEIVDIDGGLPTITEEQGDEDTDVKMEDVPFDSNDQDKNNYITFGSCANTPSILENSPVDQLSEDTEKTPEKSTHFIADGIASDPNIVLDHVSSVLLKSPAPSVSPRLNSSRKSLRTSSSMTASQSIREAAVMKPSSNILFDSRPNSRSCFVSTEQLAATLNRGLDTIQSQHSQRTAPAISRTSFRFSCLVADGKTAPCVLKVDAGVQTDFHDGDSSENDAGEPFCSKCKSRYPEQESVHDHHGQSMQLVPVTKSSAEEYCTKQVPKAVEKVLAGAIRREMALEEMCAKQNIEIMHLNRLVQQYIHERECNDIINQTREDKISRLESLMDGVLPTSEFMNDELLSITHEHRILQEQYVNHPDVLRTKIELERAHDELERYQNFFDLGERDILLEEIHDLRNQLQFYVDSSSKTTKKQVPLLELPSTCELPSTELSITPNFTEEKLKWSETESKRISLVEELKLELESNRSTIQKQNLEINMERRCSEELKEALQMAMEGHARMLEQYAELEEKHMELLSRNRQIQDGIENVKKAASKAGVKGAESRFINALATEISVLKVEREKERLYLIDENKVLHAQLKDTAEAVQAAGELLVRLKEAEEAVAAAKKRAIAAERETENAYKEVDKLNNLLQAPHLPKEEIPAEIGTSDNNQLCREEFAPTYDVEEEPSSWFSGYDRCNI